VKPTIIAGKAVPIEAVALLEPERRAISAHFHRHDVTASQVAIVEAYARLDEKIQDSINRSGLLPACHEGCAWCCHGVKINVTAPEALVIAERLKSMKNELLPAVQVAADRRCNMNTDQYFMSGEPCPFLGASNECTIYDVRPMACRRHCCLDASECERAVKNPKLKLPVSQHAPANAVGAISGFALAAALEDAKLDFRTFELASAVSVALREDAAKLWFAGERIFDLAIRPVDAEDRRIAEADLARYSPDSGTPNRALWKSHSKKKRLARRP
jgi:Fe-S-cluster containining protein